MRGIIVLHKPVIGKLLSDEWDKRGFQDVAEEIRIHDTIQDANLGGALSAYPGPNMNFQGMLGFRLLLRRLVDLPVAGTVIPA